MHNIQTRTIYILEATTRVLWNIKAYSIGTDIKSRKKGITKETWQTHTSVSKEIHRLELASVSERAFCLALKSEEEKISLKQSRKITFCIASRCDRSDVDCL